MTLENGHTREMMDSGIQWIGEIPKGTPLCRLKFLSYMKGRIGWQGLKSEDFIEEGPYCVTGTDFVNGHINWNTCYHVSEERYEMDPFIQLRIGDLLVTKDGTIGKLAKVTELPDKACLNSHLLIIRPTSGQFTNEYLYYVMASPVFTNYYRYTSTGSIMDSLSQKNTGEFAFPLYDIEEQSAIVSFLDSRCAKIDEAISRHKQITGKLEEYRKSVITQAVTKGLDPNVEMKDSGFRYAPLIPDNWSVIRITRILDYSHPYPIGDGDHGSIKSDSYVDSGIPFIRVQNLSFGNSLQCDNLVYITKEQNQTISNSTLRPNDIIFAKTGATIGKTGIIPEDMPIANTTSHVGKITVSPEIVPKYIFYYLSSDCGYHQFWEIAEKKTTRPELSIDEIKTLQIILPNNKSEQLRIVKYLDNISRNISTSVLQHEAAIEKLEEYRKSLIYNAVTGKIDCRKEA